MRFAAGMGIGLIFFGVSEPMSHFASSMGGISLENGVRTDWAPLGGASEDGSEWQRRQSLKKSTAVGHGVPPEIWRNYREKSRYDPYRILPEDFPETKTSVREGSLADQRTVGMRISAEIAADFEGHNTCYAMVRSEGLEEEGFPNTCRALTPATSAV